MFFKPLAKNLLIPLGLVTSASLAEAGIHEKIFLESVTTTLKISNEEMEDIMDMVKSFEI